MGAFSIPARSRQSRKSISGVESRVSDMDFSYKLGAHMEFNRNAVIYASYTRGYKRSRDQRSGAVGPGYR